MSKLDVNPARRKFLKFLGLGLGAVVAYPVASAIGTSERFMALTSTKSNSRTSGFASNFWSKSEDLPLAKTFTSNKYGFTLSHPSEYEVKTFDEGRGGNTFLFQKPGDQHGFQVFVVPHKGNVVTKDRIKKDLPLGKVGRIKKVNIGEGRNIGAIAFNSEADEVGELAETWFVRDDFLYEFTTYGKLDTWFGGVLDTLSFKDNNSIT